MWIVERVQDRHVDVKVVGIAGVSLGKQRVDLDVYYMIKDDLTGEYIYDSTNIAPKRYHDFSDAIHKAALLIERDFPKEVKFNAS